MTKKLNEYEEEDQLTFADMFRKPKRFIQRERKLRDTLYPIDGYIESFEQFDDLVELLVSSQEGDTVRLYISSGGGRLDIADMIVQRICEAMSNGVQVIAECGQNVASAATFIALHCSDLEVSPHCQFVIHPWSSGLGWGFAENLATDAAFNKKQSERFMRDTYSGFLNKDELESVIKYPRDLSYNAEEVLERWDNMLAYRQAEFEAIMEEAQRQFEEANKPPAPAKKKSPAKKTSK